MFKEKTGRSGSLLIGCILPVKNNNSSTITCVLHLAKLLYPEPLRCSLQRLPQDLVIKSISKILIKFISRDYKKPNSMFCLFTN